MSVVRDSSVVLTVPLDRCEVPAGWQEGPLDLIWPRGGSRALRSVAATRRIYLSDGVADMVGLAGPNRWHDKTTDAQVIIEGAHVEVPWLELVRSPHVSGGGIAALHLLPLVETADELATVVAELTNVNPQHGAAARSLIERLVGQPVGQDTRRLLALVAWDSDAVGDEAVSLARSIARLHRYPEPNDAVERTTIHMSDDWLGVVNRFGLFINRGGPRSGDEASGRDFRIHAAWTDLMVATTVQLQSLLHLEAAASAVSRPRVATRDLERLVVHTNEVEHLLQQTRVADQGPYDAAFQRMHDVWNLTARTDAVRRRVMATVDVRRMSTTAQLTFVTTVFTVAAVSVSLAVATWAKRSDPGIGDLAILVAGWSLILCGVSAMIARVHRWVTRKD